MYSFQFPLGLFDCNENKTQQVIRLLKQLTEKYVPLKDNGEVIDEVFFGGNFTLIYSVQTTIYFDPQIYRKMYRCAMIVNEKLLPDTKGGTS